MVEGFHLDGLRILSLLFVDDVVFLASSVSELQLAPEQSAAKMRTRVCPKLVFSAGKGWSDIAHLTFD